MSGTEIDVTDDVRLAYAEAVQQMRVRPAGGDTWSAPAVFWAAVRYGVGLEADGWPAAADRWCALYAVALAEHLPPVPVRKALESVPGRRTPLVDGRSRAAQLKGLIGKKGE